MKKVIALYLRFTGKEYSTLYKVLAMVPGIIVFLVVAPFVIFQLSAALGSLIPLQFPRLLELWLAALSLVVAVPLMSWALFELWVKGEGTPAPIAPTRKLVVTGPYRWCRNPIELGTNLYFLALGIVFDSLVTGILCMCFGLLLGTAYIKFIEEKEMLVRFNKSYKVYLRRVPFMAIPFLSRAESIEMRN